MKVSDFVGKKIKEIVLENPVTQGGGTLIIFEDGSKFMTHQGGKLFFDKTGEHVEYDVAGVPFTEFFKKTA